MILRIDRSQFEISIFDAQTAMERCEREAGMDPKATVPTIELLRSVAAWAKRQFCVQLTLTAAWQLWWAVCELLDKARKAQQRIADVGAWCHIDGTRLAEYQLYGLLANVPRIQAQQRLHAGQFDAMDYEGVYQLVLLATGDEQQARSARTLALERYVDSRCGGK
jgi:hypothetical protein